MLTLLLGTDWVANRDEILRLVAQDVSQSKSGRILMVPEFISHETERRLCSVAGNTTSRFAEVLSFSRLASRVADSLGHVVQPCLDNGGRVVAMAAAARQLHSKLKAYASLETKPEFLTGLVDAVDEFKRCCILPADLRWAAEHTEGSLAQKLEELALLFESYNAICSRGKRDPRDQMTLLLEELECSTFAHEHVFYIDGFPDFTRQNMAILEHLICHAPDVTISLNCDEASTSLLAFHKAGETAAELIRCARDNGVPFVVRRIQSRRDQLAIVREKLFQGDITEKLDNDLLKVYHTQSLRQECVAAAERIIELVENGARYRDISVVCADLATYSSVLEMVFERCHIPVYISGTEAVLRNSVITTVLSALETAFGGFEQQDVFHYMKSMLSPLDLTTCDKLQSYAMLWNISGATWLKKWENHPDGLGQAWGEESRIALEALNSARAQIIEPLVSLKSDFKAAENMEQQVRSVYQFLEEIDMAGQLDRYAQQFNAKGDNRSAQILNQLWEILLSALEQLHDVLGQTSWGAEVFVRLFKLLLSQYDVGTIPPVLDAVTVGPVSAMRCQQTKHLLVLGVSEGCMPGYTGSSGVLTDHERTTLRQIGVPLTGGAMDGLMSEFAEIYGVFCGAETSVTVSYSGDQSSFVYRRLLSLAGQTSEASCELGAAMRDVNEASAYLARHNASDAAETIGISDLFLEFCRQKDHTLGSVSAENIKKLYGSALSLSASQIDRQAECRLSYFLRYGLRAKEQKTATVDPAEFGTYVHAVLENTGREIASLGGFGNVTAEQTLQIARKYSDQYAKERFSQLDTQRLSYLFRRNRQELELIVSELWSELHNSKFKPVGFEVAFGSHGALPAIPISGKTMQARLKGFVDRVDCWNDGQCAYFRVVDYKTGKKDFDYCDIFNGIGLQMLLYLFALEQEGQSLLGDNTVPAGVQYFPARVPLVSADGILSDEEAALAREKVWKRKGLLLSDENVLDAMEPGDKPVRMPFTRKKDGTLSGDLADRAQFDALKKYIFGFLSNMVDEIASGCVTPNPYTRGSIHNACTYCPYNAVCHDAMLDNRRNYKAVSAQQFWQDVMKEVSDRG